MNKTGTSILRTSAKIGRLCLMIWISGTLSYFCSAKEHESDLEVPSTLTRVAHTETCIDLSKDSFSALVENENCVIKACIDCGGIHAYLSNPAEFRRNVYAALGASFMMVFIFSLACYYVPAVMSYS